MLADTMNSPIKAIKVDGRRHIFTNFELRYEKKNLLLNLERLLAATHYLAVVGKTLETLLRSTKILLYRELFCDWK